MHLLVANFQGNPNIGAFGVATDSYCLVGQSIPEDTCRKIQEALQVPVHRVIIAGTDLIGVFCVANNKQLLIPDLCFESELRALRDLKIPFTIIKTDLTALGNNIACNDHGAIISPLFSDKEKKLIEDALGVKSERLRLAGTEVPGTSIVSTNTRAIAHRDAEQHELDIIAKTMQVECDTGSVNLGVPFMRIAVINNSKGLVVSQATTGPEINNLDHGLGYL